MPESVETNSCERIEGAWAPGERVVLVEDVVTSGGAALEAVDALRDAGLVVETAICVMDRESGGQEAMAARGIRLAPLFTASSVGMPTS